MYWKIIGGILVCLVIAAVLAFGYDQYAKRKQELDNYRHELAKMEEQVRNLEARLGRSHEQTKSALAEVERLRQVILTLQLDFIPNTQVKPEDLN